VDRIHGLKRFGTAAVNGRVMRKLLLKNTLIAAVGILLWIAVPANAQPFQLGYRTLQNAPQPVPAPDARPATDAPLPPAVLTVPAGTVLLVELSDTVSSKDQHAGDAFIAELQHPIVVDGWVIARRGQTVTGHIAATQRAGRVKGTSKLSLELEEVNIVDGQQISVQSEQVENSGPTSRGRDALGVAVTAAVGAAIGAVCGAKGAAIGATAGAAVGFAGVLLTRGEDTQVGPEKVLAFRLASPITISTEHSQHAFWQIASDDYILPDEIPQPQAVPVTVIVAQPAPQFPAIILPELQTLASARPGRRECGN